MSFFPGFLTLSSSTISNADTSGTLIKCLKNKSILVVSLNIFDCSFNNLGSFFSSSVSGKWAFIFPFNSIGGKGSIFLKFLAGSLNASSPLVKAAFTFF